MNRKHQQSTYHANVNAISNGIKINVDANAENIIYEKDYTWNPATCICENGRCLASIIDDLVITCDEIIDAEDTNFNEKACKTKKICILLALSLITIALLIAASIYCYLIKYKSKQKH